MSRQPRRVRPSMRLARFPRYSCMHTFEGLRYVPLRRLRYLALCLRPGSAPMPLSGHLSSAHALRRAYGGGHYLMALNRRSAATSCVPEPAGAAARRRHARTSTPPRRASCIAGAKR